MELQGRAGLYCPLFYFLCQTFKRDFRNGTIVTLKWKYFTNLFKCGTICTNQIASFDKPMTNHIVSSAQVWNISGDTSFVYKQAICLVCGRGPGAVAVAPPQLAGSRT